MKESEKTLDYAYSGWVFSGQPTDGGCKKFHLPKIFHTYPAMIKLGSVIPYLKKMKKTYKSRDTPLDFTDISIFHRKSATFAISRNVDIDCVFIHNF